MGNRKQKLTFEEWYSNLLDVMSKWKRYEGKSLPDREIAEADYTKGYTPSYSFRQFQKSWEMDDDDDTPDMDDLLKWEDEGEEDD